MTLRELFPNKRRPHQAPANTPGQADTTADRNLTFEVCVGVSGEYPFHNPDLDHLLATARDILFHSEAGLRHLATMTFGDKSPDQEDLTERVKDIVTYLESHFPIIRLHDMGDDYAYTPEPQYLERYPNLLEAPWLSRSFDERKKLTLEICLNFRVFDLFLRSYAVDNKRCLLSFLFHVTIIHELSHVIIYIFSSTPTPVKYRGDRQYNQDGLDKSGVEVARGESGASLEHIMVGGDVDLIIPDGCELHNVDPKNVYVIVDSGETNTSYKILQLGTRGLTRIAEGNWNLIKSLLPEPFPAGFTYTKMKQTASKASTSMAHPFISHAPHRYIGKY